MLYLRPNSTRSKRNADAETDLPFRGYSVTIGAQLASKLKRRPPVIPMTLLEIAVEKAKQLPPDLQDAVAASLLADIEAELNWDETLDASSETLANMAEEALKEFRAGRTLPLDPDKL